MGKGVKVWYEESDINPSSGGPPDWFTVGSADTWGAAGSGLTVNRGIGEGTVLETKEDVVVARFLVGRDSAPWLEVEREPLSAIDEMVLWFLVLGRQQCCQRFDRFREEQVKSMGEVLDYVMASS